MAVAAALLLAYVLIWARLPTADIDRSDFTSSYVAGLLLRHDGGATVYNLATQTALRDHLIAPVHNGEVPFVDGPPAAALVAPVTFLSLTAAYRLWTALSLLLLALAVVIAVRSAPWRATTSTAWRAAAGMVAMASFGTWTLLLQGQWSSLTALGLALAYRDWRNGHQVRGAVILVLAAGVAKPHLALGLAAFLIGWRQRRVIVGAIAGLAALAVASVAVVGTAGVMAFAGLATAQGGAWDLRADAELHRDPRGNRRQRDDERGDRPLRGTAVACASPGRSGTWRAAMPGALRPRAHRGGGPLAARRPARLCAGPRDACPVLVWAIALAVSAGSRWSASGH